MELINKVVAMVTLLRARYDAWVASTPPAVEVNEWGMEVPVLIEWNVFDERNEWMAHEWRRFVRGLHGLYVTLRQWNMYLAPDAHEIDHVLFWDLLGVGYFHMENGLNP